jgi:transglutaminase-like putative cysteine protease
MIYRISHTTGYHYSAPASLSQNELLLSPRQTPTQEVIETNLLIEPVPQYSHSRTDYFGNTVQLFMVQHPHDQLAISATSTVRTSKPVFPGPAAALPWERAVQRIRLHEQTNELDAYQFIFASPLVTIPPEAKKYAQQSFGPETPLLEGTLDLVRRIYSDFTYDKAASTVDTTVEQILQNRKGVCQDFAHLAISCLRSLGLAARYVSGYLETIPPPGKPKLVGSDASHAWFSLFIPDFGWVDLDPTNNLLTIETHITVAWGRDYGDVAPVKGVVMGGGLHELGVTVDVSRARY